MLSKNLSDSKYWAGRQELGFKAIGAVFVLLKTAYTRPQKGPLVPKKAAYSVILSAAKDLLGKASQEVKEILRFAQNDRLILTPR